MLLLGSPFAAVLKRHMIPIVGDFDASEWLKVSALVTAFIYLGAKKGEVVNRIESPIENPTSPGERTYNEMLRILGLLTIEIVKHDSYADLLRVFGLDAAYPFIYKRPLIKIADMHYMPIPSLVDLALTRKLDSTLASLISDKRARHAFMHDVSMSVETDTCSMLSEMFPSYISPEKELGQGCDFYFEVDNWRVLGDVKWIQAFDEFGFRDSDLGYWDAERFTRFVDQVEYTIEKLALKPNVLLCISPDYMQVWNVDFNFNEPLRRSLPSLLRLPMRLYFVSYQEMKQMWEWRRPDLLARWLNDNHESPEKHCIALKMMLDSQACGIRGNNLLHDQLLTRDLNSQSEVEIPH
jgi:hypothetical protein